jgi:hypothetical protein
MEYRWNNTDRGKVKDSEETLPQSTFIRYKSYTEALEANPDFRGENLTIN